jgi:hypothetical protein
VTWRLGDPAQVQVPSQPFGDGEILFHDRFHHLRELGGVSGGQEHAHPMAPLSHGIRQGSVSYRGVRIQDVPGFLVDSPDAGSGLLVGETPARDVFPDTREPSAVEVEDAVQVAGLSHVHGRG